MELHLSASDLGECDNSPLDETWDPKGHLALKQRDLMVKTLGPCRIPSPLLPLLKDRRPTYHAVEEGDRVLLDDTISALSLRKGSIQDLPAFEPAGPRNRIYFDPSKSRVGIVTCGGLCPGVNDVVRALVLELSDWYGVRKIHGFRNGYQGFIASYGRQVVDLDRQAVARINEHGGTILGTSRGRQDASEIVDCLERMSINILFVIGGDGTMRGVLEISREIAARQARIAVVGIPKTIDNDVAFIDQSFGFQTAFTEAAKSIRAAHAEATASPNGIGLVRLMGRHSGFIACYGSLAIGDADVVLIPEVAFSLGGEKGLLRHIEKLLVDRGHAVIVVAEGAGQDLMVQSRASAGTDASGNARLLDIGVFLKDRIQEYFKDSGRDINLKYIDPSYTIRSVPANPFDAVYCIRLAHNAVHAAMAGRTEMVVGRWHGRFIHVPIPLAIRQRNTVDPDGDLWMSVLESTGQPRTFAQTTI